MANWYMKRGSLAVGPGTTEQLRAAYNKGSITADNLIRREDSEDWIRLGDSGVLGPLNDGKESNDGYLPDHSGGAMRSAGSRPRIHRRMFQERPTYSSQEPVMATIYERFLALIIDGLTVFVVGAVLKWMVGSFFVLSMALGLGYFVLMQRLWGYTIGRKIMGIHIELEKNGRPDFTHFVIRYLMQFLSGIILFVGYFIAFGDPKKRTLHDRVAGTMVLKD
jgi:uncharacterized RDD family membrane protein YckC